jgi:hypothetical protein
MQTISQNFDPFPYEHDKFSDRCKKETFKTHDPDQVLVMPCFGIPHLGLNHEYKLFEKIIFELEYLLEELSENLSEKEYNERASEIYLHLVSGYPSFPKLWYKS